MVIKKSDWLIQSEEQCVMALGPCVMMSDDDDDESMMMIQSEMVNTAASVEIPVFNIAEAKNSA